MVFLVSLLRVASRLWSALVGPQPTAPSAEVGKEQAADSNYLPCLTCDPDGEYDVAVVGDSGSGLAVARVRPLYQEFFKVVYVARAHDLAALSAETFLPVKSTVCVLVLRTRVGITRVFDNDTGQLVSPNSLGERTQYALDEALVVAAKFLDRDGFAARTTARQYQNGEDCLVPQLCVHNRDLAMLRYEVGSVVHVSDAGRPGLNGCVTGVHVHLLERDAMVHAQSMSLQNYETEAATSSVLAREPVVVYDKDVRLKWFQWHHRPTPWEDDESTQCLSCVRPMNGSGPKYAVMGCGHGYLCQFCARTAQAGEHQCPECSIGASRATVCAW